MKDLILGSKEFIQLNTDFIDYAQRKQVGRTSSYLDAGLESTLYLGSLRQARTAKSASRSNFPTFQRASYSAVRLGR